MLRTPSTVCRINTWMTPMSVQETQVINTGIYTGGHRSNLVRHTRRKKYKLRGIKISGAAKI
jgi:hypothetical protein